MQVILFLVRCRVTKTMQEAILGGCDLKGRKLDHGGTHKILTRLRSRRFTQRGNLDTCGAPWWPTVSKRCTQQTRAWPTRQLSPTSHRPTRELPQLYNRLTQIHPAKTHEWLTVVTAVSADCTPIYNLSSLMRAKLAFAECRLNIAVDFAVGQSKDRRCAAGC